MISLFVVHRFGKLKTIRMQMKEPGGWGRSKDCILIVSFPCETFTVTDMNGDPTSMCNFKGIKEFSRKGTT